MMFSGLFGAAMGSARQEGDDVHVALAILLELGLQALVDRAHVGLGGLHVFSVLGVFLSVRGCGGSCKQSLVSPGEPY